VSTSIWECPTKTETL